MNVGGVNYEAVGASTKPLLLQNLGGIKFQYGNKFIDLIKNGKINVNSDFIFEGKEFSKDGIYVDEETIYLYYNGQEYILSSNVEGYVSYTDQQELTQEQQEQALNNIGLICQNKNDITIQNGIAFVLDEGKIYTCLNGTISELVVNSNASQGDVSTLKYNNVVKLEAQNDLVPTANLVFPNNYYLKNKTYSSDTGYKLYIDSNEQSVLDIDVINLRDKINYLKGTSLTYDQLISKINENGLSPKEQYIITDFQNIWEITYNIYTEDNIDQGQKTNVRPIVVTAKSVNTLYEEAYYKDNPQWTLHYQIDCPYTCFVTEENKEYYIWNGSDWEFNNEYAESTVTREGFAKGWISYLKDENGNEANYDFKNLVFVIEDNDTREIYHTFSDINLTETRYYNGKAYTYYLDASSNVQNNSITLNSPSLSTITCNVNGGSNYLIFLESYSGNTFLNWNSSLILQYLNSFSNNTLYEQIVNLSKSTTGKIDGCTFKQNLIFEKDEETVGFVGTLEGSTFNTISKLDVFGQIINSEFKEKCTLILDATSKISESIFDKTINTTLINSSIINCNSTDSNIELKDSTLSESTFIKLDGKITEGIINNVTGSLTGLTIESSSIANTTFTKLTGLIKTTEIKDSAFLTFLQDSESIIVNMSTFNQDVYQLKGPGTIENCTFYKKLTSLTLTSGILSFDTFYGEISDVVIKSTIENTTFKNILSNTTVEKNLDGCTFNKEVTNGTSVLKQSDYINCNFNTKINNVVTDTTASYKASLSSFEPTQVYIIENDDETWEIYITSDSVIELPSGVILMWTSQEIPTGWVVCNGKNGTPDLQGSFIKGAVKNEKDEYQIGAYPETAGKYNLPDDYISVTSNVFKYKFDLDNVLSKDLSEKEVEEIKEKYKIGYVLLDEASEIKLSHAVTYSEQEVQNPEPSYYALIFIMKL